MFITEASLAVVAFETSEATKDVGVNDEEDGASLLLSPSHVWCLLLWLLLRLWLWLQWPWKLLLGPTIVVAQQVNLAGRFNADAVVGVHNMSCNRPKMGSKQLTTLDAGVKLILGQ